MHGGMCGREHAWQEGVHGTGACMAGGVYGKRVCMVEGGMHGRGGMRGRRDDHSSGRYVSYWNAFLFHDSFLFPGIVSLLVMRQGNNVFS